MRPADVRDMCRMAHILSKFGSWKYIFEKISFVKKKSVLVKKLHSYSSWGVKPLNILEDIIFSLLYHNKQANAPKDIPII